MGKLFWREALVNELMQLNLNPDVRPARLLEYLQDRAGVLEPRGVGISAFPHRTFQEYLAACHLTEHDDFPDNVAELLRAEPNRWREVTLLAGAKAVRGATSNAWNLADALCFADPPTEKLTDEAGYWGALLAGQVLIENRSLERIAERNQSKLERIRIWLMCTLTQEALPPIDRALAGDVLARIGDPRFREDAWWLPDDGMLGFVEIPAGKFVMGSDKERDSDAMDEEIPQHTLSLPCFYMARYPVTAAQFRVFVEGSGYKPQYEQSLQGLPNHPVSAVTWYDALAYCKWLTEQLSAAEHLSESLARLVRGEGWRVTLPSEAEWEKAARGTDGRVYPWGDKFDATKANVGETGIERTSAVGSFLSGASPYGMLDMSGNVWEWTRSLWGKEYGKPDFAYPYDPQDGREELTESNDVSRVLRGGGFFHDRRSVRCAFRDWNLPGYVNDYGGFRVVVLPNSEL